MRKEQEKTHIDVVDNKFLTLWFSNIVLAALESVIGKSAVSPNIRH